VADKKTLKGLNALKSSLIEEGDTVIVHGFGTFRVCTTETKVRRNPKTGKVVTTPGRKVVKFKCSKLFFEENYAVQDSDG